MVNSEILAFEDAVLAALTFCYFDEHRIDSVLPTFRGYQSKRELGTDDRDIATQLEQEGNCANMVLMRMRQDQRFNVLEAVFDMPKVRQDEVDARLVVTGK
jgi:hypothetical protein